MYLGRHYNFPTALEGALKLKEISYVHAEGYPAAEMKHGPIALVDKDTPSVFVMPQGFIYEKVMSNLEETKARGGPVIAIAAEGDTRIAEVCRRRYLHPANHRVFAADRFCDSASATVLSYCGDARLRRR